VIASIEWVITPETKQATQSGEIQMLKKAIIISVLLGSMLMTQAQQNPQEPMNPMNVRMNYAVDSIELVNGAEGYDLIIRGILPDDCNDPKTSVQRSGATLFVDLYRDTVPDRACIETVTNYEHRIALPELTQLDADATIASVLAVNDFWVRLSMPMIEPGQGTELPIPNMFQLGKDNLNVNEVTLVRNENNLQTVTILGEMGCGYLVARAYPSPMITNLHNVEVFLALDPMIRCITGSAPFEITLNPEALFDASFNVNGFIISPDPTISSNIQNFAINEVNVESYTATTQFTFPPTVSFEISGTRDGCEFPIEAVPSFLNDVVELRVARVMPLNTPCTRIAQPYQTTTALVLPADFQSGSYPLVINGEQRGDIQL
jgi:hypothetical protein